MPDEATLIAELQAKIAALEKDNEEEHKKHGYQLGAQDVRDLDDLIQRALKFGAKDGLIQLMAIRTAWEIHGLVSYEQLKFFKEVRDAISAS